MCFIRFLELLLWNFSDKRDLSLEILFEYALYFDFLTVTSICIYASPLFIAEQLIKKDSVLLSRFLFLTITITHIILTIFYFESSYLLGNEIVRYSFEQAWFITSSAINTTSLLFCVALIVLIYFFNKKAFGLKLPMIINTIAVLLPIVLFFVTIKNYDHLINSKDPKYFVNRQDYFQANNKLVFLTHSNLNLFSPPTYDELDKIESYPFLKNSSKSCSLCMSFKDSITKPNIVIILTESLSSSFSGKTNYLGSFTPFLDSLSKQSLYWPNCLSATERTYGAIPAILSSCANGTKQGMVRRRNVGDISYPYHKSIIELLSSNGYETAFGYSGKSDFDEMNSYLHQKGIENIYDLTQLEKNDIPHEEQYAWGMGDTHVFNESIKRVKEYKNPFFELLLTTAIHSPFDQGEKYLSFVDTTSLPKNIMSSVLFSDQSIKEYLNRFSKLKKFKNTIFIIVGDHNVGDLPLKNEIETFRVPLLIYSKLLKRTGYVTSITSHKAIYPALTSLLENKCNINVTWPRTYVVKDLPADTVFKTDLQTSLCLYHEQEQTNLIMGKYILRGREASEIINEQLNLKPVTDKKIIDSLCAYKRLLILQDYKCELEGYQIPKD